MGDHHAREIVGVYLRKRAKMYKMYNLLESVMNMQVFPFMNINEKVLIQLNIKKKKPNGGGLRARGNKRRQQVRNPNT